MQIYILKANLNNYQTLAPRDSGALQHYRRFNGQPLPDPTGTPPLAVLQQDPHLPAGDFPGLTSHVPVFSPAGVRLLGQLLEAAGQLLPLRCSNCHQAYTALNVTRLVDALDQDRSHVKRYASSGRIMRILQYQFLAPRVQCLGLFKIPQTALQEVYATQPVVERVAGSSLQGLVFQLVWTTRATVILCPYCLGLIGEQTGLCPTCGLDTRNDAPLEMTLEEVLEIKREPCCHRSSYLSRVWPN
jgi:hypothetical protein